MKATFAVMGMLIATSFSMVAKAEITVLAVKDTKNVTSQYTSDKEKGSYDNCRYLVRTNYSDKPHVVGVTIYASDEKPKKFVSSSIFSNGTDEVMIDRSDLPLADGFARSTEETNEKFTAKVSVSYRAGVLSIDRKVTYHETFLSLYMGGNTATHADIKVSADLKKVVAAKGSDLRRIEAYSTFDGVTKHDGTSITKASFSCKF